MKYIENYGVTVSYSRVRLLYSRGETATRSKTKAGVTRGALTSLATGLRTNVVYEVMCRGDYKHIISHALG